MIRHDPLTCDWRQLVFGRPRPCDCPPEAYHSETCWTTPIYAQCVKDLGSPVLIMHSINGWLLT